MLEVEAARHPVWSGRVDETIQRRSSSRHSRNLHRGRRTDSIHCFCSDGARGSCETAPPSTRATEGSARADSCRCTPRQTALVFGGCCSNVFFLESVLKDAPQIGSVASSLLFDRRQLIETIQDPFSRPSTLSSSPLSPCIPRSRSRRHKRRGLSTERSSCARSRPGSLA